MTEQAPQEQIFDTPTGEPDPDTAAGATPDLPARRGEGPSITDWLVWWDVLSPPTGLDEGSLRGVREAVELIPQDARDAVRGALERQYKEVNDDIASVRARAGGLVTTVGLVFAALALVSPVSAAFRTLSGIWPGPALLLGVLASILVIVLAYLALGVLWLSLRAQQVGFWGQSEMHPVEARAKRVFEAEYLFSLYVTHQENLARLRNPVGYLRHAQGYVLVLLATLVLLVTLSVGVLGLSIYAEHTSRAAPTTPLAQPTAPPTSQTTQPTPRPASAPRTP